MTEKAVRQLRTNFEKLGARLGENLAGQSYPSMLLRIERVRTGLCRDPKWGRLHRLKAAAVLTHCADQSATHTEHSRDLGLVVSRSDCAGNVLATAESCPC